MRQFATLSIVACSAGLAGYYFQRREQPQTITQPPQETQQARRKRLAPALKAWHHQVSTTPCGVWNSNWDFRDPATLVRPKEDDSPEEENRYNSELKKYKTKAARHIILIRHGEYLDAGDTDDTHRLTPRGRMQAMFTGKRLHEMKIQWDDVFASTMIRAQETSDIILKEIDFEASKRKNCSYLREGIPIEPQPSYSGSFEPSKIFRDSARIEAAFRRYFYRANPEQKADSHTLLIGHGNVIRYFVCRALQLPPEAWLRISVNHASITWLTIYPSGNVSISYLGDSGYMPTDHLTFRLPRNST